MSKESQSSNQSQAMFRFIEFLNPQLAGETVTFCSFAPAGPYSGFLFRC
jgi:hypothetical protein